MEKDIDRKKLLSAVGELYKNEKLARAVESKDMDGIFSSLSKEQARELKTVLSDKAQLEKILNSPQAKQIMRAFNKDGN